MERWKILIGILPFCGITVGYTQTGKESWIQDNGTTISVFDKSGKPFVNTYSDVEGSAFFWNDWKDGQLIMYNNAVYNHIKLRLNLQNQQVHFISQDGTEKVAHEGSVKEITLYDSTAGHTSSRLFRSGFPPIDKQDTKNFYEVLADGKIPFLRSSRKFIMEQKDPLSGEVRKEFVNYDDYYVFTGGNTMTHVKKDKTFILNLLNDKEEKIKAFIDDNKFKFRSFDDITKVIVYYNSLP